MTTKRCIDFSPPDITEEEIAEVTKTLRSGWITTGPKTKELEKNLAHFVHVDRVACLSSATAALECALRLLDIGPGDEVITTAYTYTASCSPICHVGATPRLCDCAPDSYEMDYASLEALISPRTKALIAVDLAGRMANYDQLFNIVQGCTQRWQAKSPLQEHLGRIAIIADAAHALGAQRLGKTCGSVADLSAFSFHAVKNLTTAEGGALCWKPGLFNDDDIYNTIMLQSLHGQTKDAFAKMHRGSWEYDVSFPGWKCNLTDIAAALGLVQLRRYPQMLKRRRQMIEHYEKGLSSLDVDIFKHYGDTFSSSGHLMLVRLLGKTQSFRNALIEALAQDGIATNVHYKPLPLLSAYQKLGFTIADFPHAQAQFENEITLPLHTLLSDADIDYIIDSFSKHYHALCASR